MEMMHKCRSRALVLRELRNLVPLLVESPSDGWFRTLNTADEVNAANMGTGTGPSSSSFSSSSYTCLFDGAKLELKVSSPDTPEFGLCFSRLSFAAERDALDLDALSSQQPAGDWAGWTRREPSNSDRLRVNKRGREILYFVRPPQSQADICVSDLKAEVCHTLRIDSRRVSLAAGSFYWGPEFVEDGLGMYSTYFDSDPTTETDSHHMRTMRGAALVDVIEMPINSP